MSARIDPCPLCSTQQARLVSSVPYEEVWAALEDEWRTPLPSSITSRYDQIGEARLYECGSCGLRYFSPLLAGDAGFYSRLSRNPTYYVDDRWEFHEVLSRLGDDDEVIDFGAGNGAFMKLIASRVRRVVGCDHNDRASELEMPANATLVGASFDDVAEKHQETFDVATAFHVLEHVPSAAMVCRPAVRALRPGGRLLLSTPDAARTLRSTFEVLDYPPHHLSRWTDAQYERLADVFGLELLSIDHEPFVHRRTRLRRALPASVVYAGALAVSRLRGVEIQRPRGLPFGVHAERWPRGTSVLAEFRRL